MKNFLSRGCLFCIAGIFLGFIIGVIVHFINWYGLNIGLSQLTRTDQNFVMLTIVFGIVGAILIGILGLIVGLIIAYRKKPEK